VESLSGVKRPGPGADHKLQNSAQVKNAWSYTFTLPCALVPCKGATVHVSLLMLLFKHRHSNVSNENCSPWQDGLCAYTLTAVQGMATKDSYRIFSNLIRTLFEVSEDWKIRCGLDSQSRAGFWKNDRVSVRAVRTKTKLRGLSPRANYTDRAAAAGRRS
jgi:hypothetical protein